MNLITRSAASRNLFIRRRWYTTRGDIRLPPVDFREPSPNDAASDDISPSSLPPPSDSNISAAGPSTLELSPNYPPPPPPPPPSDSFTLPPPPEDGGISSALATIDQPPIMNPFHTHAFFKSLTKEFSDPIAHTLMRATQEMLVNRISQAKREGLDKMDMENEAYLYRAALSELRTELTMRTRNDSATLQTSTTAIRKDVESLTAKMKEDIATLKHEIQMETNNRKNEVNSDMKVSAIAIEDLHHKSTITISDIRTAIEQAKWDNTRRGVAIIGSFVIFVIASLEMAPKPSPKPPPPPPTAPFLPSSQIQQEIVQLDLREFEEASEG